MALYSDAYDKNIAPATVAGRVLFVTSAAAAVATGIAWCLRRLPAWPFWVSTTGLSLSLSLLLGPLAGMVGSFVGAAMDINGSDKQQLLSLLYRE
jgi:hypothetical protein